jgi:hypothetical protein
MIKPGLAVLALLAFTTGLRAQGFENYCGREGLAQPLRQTVVLLDEAALKPEPDGQPNPQNQSWRQFLGQLLLPQNPAQLEQSFAPRERVTIAVVRKDGTGSRLVFTGCMPFYSPAERDRLAHDEGAMRGLHNFFGTGPVASAKRDMDLFRIQLGNSFKTALAPEALSPAGGDRGPDITHSGLVTSLKQARLFNPAYGLPRIILYSDLGRFFGQMPAQRAAARAFGFRQGAQADVNFGNAELYLAGLSGARETLRDGLEAFALASHAELVAIAPSSSLPGFRGIPRRVLRYQGSMQYPGMRYPVRLRLAADENGNLVNSWISVQTSSEQFNPLHGTLTCAPGGTCSLVGDQQFAQVWNPQRGAAAEPNFSAAMPFGGARMLNARIHDGAISGDVSDPVVRFQDVKGARLEFSASLQSSATF